MKELYSTAILLDKQIYINTYLIEQAQMIVNNNKYFLPEIKYKLKIKIF